MLKLYSQHDLTSKVNNNALDQEYYLHLAESRRTSAIVWANPAIYAKDVHVKIILYEPCSRHILLIHHQLSAADKCNTNKADQYIFPFYFTNLILIMITFTTMKWMPRVKKHTTQAQNPCILMLICIPGLWWNAVFCAVQ